MVDVGAHDFQGLVTPLLRGIAKRLQNPVANVVQAVVGADRPGFRANHLHAVVVFRVVAGGYHDAAVHLVVAGGEIYLFGAAQADIKHIRTGCHEAGAQRLGNVRARKTDVVADDHLFSAGNFHVGAPDFLGQSGVELIRHTTTQVVCLEAGQVHCQELLRARLQLNIILNTHLGNHFQLGLEPVDVLFLAFQNATEDFA